MTLCLQPFSLNFQRTVNDIRMDKLLSGILLAVTASFIKPTEQCLHNWIHDEEYDVCYKLFKSPQKTWNEANTFCVERHKSATLSMTHNYLQHKSMVDLVLKTKNFKKSVWLGAYHNGFHWEWIDGSKLFKGNFQWGVDRSKTDNEEKKLKYCIKTSGKDGRMHSVRCDSKISFVCSMPDSIVVTAAPSQGPNTSYTDVIVLSVLIPLCVLAVIGIIVFVLRRKGQRTTITSTSTHISANEYEDLGTRVPNREHTYSNLYADDDTNYECQSSAVTSHSASNNRIFSVVNHDYSSAYFPTSTDMLHIDSSVYQYS